MIVDEALQKLGFFGKWQLFWYSVLTLSCVFPPAWHTVSIVWIGYKPAHHCRLPANTSAFEKWVPRQDNSALSSCTMYINSSVSNDTMECANGWEFDESVSGPTIVSKWNMVCDQAYLADTAQSLLTFGDFLGAVLFSKLSDTYGRKPILIFVQLSMSIIGAFSVLPSNLQIFYVLRFFLGVFKRGVSSCHIVMVCEMFSYKNRPLVAIAVTALWGLGNAFLPLIAYLTKNWVIFELIISLYGLLFIPFFWKLPRSVPWLYANNRLQEAEEVIWKAARMNNIKFTRPILDTNSKLHDTNKTSISPKSNRNKFSKQNVFKAFSMTIKPSKANQYSYLHLFRNRILFKHLFICILFGFVDNLVYYGLTLASNTLSGNHYLNGFLMSIMEVPACIITFFCVNKYGRKWPIAAFHVVAGLSLLTTIFVSLTVEDIGTRHIILNVLTIIGKFGISGAYAIVIFYVAELFPTKLRNQAVGSYDFFKKTGAVLASYSTLMVERYPYLPPALFGSLSVIVAFCIVFVPETHNKALPETIDEIKLWYKKPHVRPEDNVIEKTSKL